MSDTEIIRRSTNIERLTGSDLEDGKQILRNENNDLNRERSAGDEKEFKTNWLVFSLFLVSTFITIYLMVSNALGYLLLTSNYEFKLDPNNVNCLIGFIAIQYIGLIICSISTRKASDLFTGMSKVR
jgi:hypothetical protein